MIDESCVFCQIVAGTLPSEIVCRDEHFVAFRDIAPKASTHLLIVPRSHVCDLDQWVDEKGSSDSMLAFVRQVGRDLGVSGRYRLITNVGSAAGQVVFHLHWHMLAGDDLPGF